MFDFIGNHIELIISLITLIIQIFLLFVAIGALTSIEETRKSRSSHVERDTARFSNEIVQFYLKDILPKLTELNDFVKVEKIKTNKSKNLHNPKEIVNGTLSKDELDQLRAILITDPNGNKYNIDLHELLNLHEGLAGMIALNLGDNDFLYSTIGNLFLSFINEHNVFIRFHRKNSKVAFSDVYPNIASVYENWHAKCMLRKSLYKKNQLDLEAETLKTDIKNNSIMAANRRVAGSN